MLPTCPDCTVVSQDECCHRCRLLRFGVICYPPGEAETDSGNGTRYVFRTYLHTRTRIQHCHSRSLAQDWGSDLIPGPGTPYATVWPKMKKQTNKKSKTKNSMALHT